MRCLSWFVLAVLAAIPAAAQIRDMKPCLGDAPGRNAVAACNRLIEEVNGEIKQVASRNYRPPQGKTKDGVLSALYNLRGGAHQTIARRHAANEESEKAAELHLRAITDFDTALRHDPASPHAVLNRGRSRAERIELESAIKDFEQALRLDPRNAQKTNALALNNRGGAYRGKGDEADALADFERALQLDPKFANAIFNRGTVHLEKERYDRAIADYTAAMRLGLKDIDAHNARGRARRDSGDYKGAVADFEAALKLSAPDKRSESVQDALRELLRALREKAEREDANRRKAEREEADRKQASRKQAEAEEAARKQAEVAEAARRKAEATEASRKRAEAEAAARAEAASKRAEAAEAARRKAGEEAAARAEAASKRAEAAEAARRKAEQEVAARKEAARQKAAEEAVQAEAARQKALAAAAAHKEAQRLEAQRRKEAEEEARRAEAAQKEAERLEALHRKEAEAEAKRAEAAQKEAERLEALRLEAEQLEAQRRKEAEKKASGERARRIALVIGNSNYHWLGRLNNPGNDAEDVAKALESLNFTVLRGINLTHAGMKEVLERFAEAAGKAEVALFFFAGHGIQRTSVNYLAPIDAGTAEVDQFVSLQEVMTSLASGQGIRIMLIDACRNNPAVGVPGPDGVAMRSITNLRGLARLEIPAWQGGMFIAYATLPGMVAADGVGRNSPFTRGFLKHLPTPGLELRHLFVRVRDEVKADTHGGQTPHVDDSLQGMFHFTAAK